MHPSSLIDEFLPVYDVRERHRTTVRASRSVTYTAIQSTDLAAAPVVRALLFLRALPAAAFAGRSALRELRDRRHEPVTLATFQRQGFRIIAERPPEEIAIGLEGQFWRSKGNLCSVSAEDFRDRGPAPGTARALWNFTVTEIGSGVELATETRVQCADETTRRRFLPYWYLIRPASGLIRRLMLRDIRRVAER